MYSLTFPLKKGVYVISLEESTHLSCPSCLTHLHTCLHITSCGNQNGIQSTAFLDNKSSHFPCKCTYIKKYTITEQNIKLKLSLMHY